MARVRKISTKPSPSRNYFLIDACFLANKYIPVNKVSKKLPIPQQERERDRINNCLDWWSEIDAQLKSNCARVFIPDICIAETFKVLAKKYYIEEWFRTAAEMNNARRRLIKDIVTPAKTLKAFKRNIKYHDISTSRDIIIAVDRFFELFMTKGHNVSVPDLIIVATAKYLLDFYDIPKDHLHIVTLDKPLWQGSKKVQELPNAYNPTVPSDFKDRVFSQAY